MGVKKISMISFFIFLITVVGNTLHKFANINASTGVVRFISTVFEINFRYVGLDFFPLFIFRYFHPVSVTLDVDHVGW